MKILNLMFMMATAVNLVAQDSRPTDDVILNSLPSLPNKLKKTFDTVTTSFDAVKSFGIDVINSVADAGQVMVDATIPADVKESILESFQATAEQKESADTNNQKKLSAAVKPVTQFGKEVANKISAVFSDKVSKEEKSPSSVLQQSDNEKGSCDDDRARSDIQASLAHQVSWLDQVRATLTNSKASVSNLIASNPYLASGAVVITIAAIGIYRYNKQCDDDAKFENN